MASKRIQKELQVRSRLPWPPCPPVALPARVTKGRRRPDPEAIVWPYPEDCDGFGPPSAF